LQNHCAITVNHTGGTTANGSVTSDAFIYNFAINNWKKIAPLKHARSLHICGRISSRGKEVVMLRGADEDSCQIVVSGGEELLPTMVFSLCDETWTVMDKSGAVDNLRGAASVQYGTSFLVTGGYDSSLGDYSGVVYTFDEGSYHWEVYAQKTLKRPRVDHVAIPVPRVDHVAIPVP
jgi:hypothetical protein